MRPVSYTHLEIGSVEPVQQIGELIKKKNPSACFHVDAIRAFGKYRIHPKRMKIDLLSASGHKIHGPKGVGFLYVNDKVRINPLILGGGQQNGMRSGTDNVPGAAGLAAAAEKIYSDLEANNAHMYLSLIHIWQVRDRMQERVPAARQAAAMTMWLMLITRKYNKLTYQERQ